MALNFSKSGGMPQEAAASAPTSPYTETSSVLTPSPVFSFIETSYERAGSPSTIESNLNLKSFYLPENFEGRMSSSSSNVWISGENHGRERSTQDGPGSSSTVESNLNVRYSPYAPGNPMSRGSNPSSNVWIAPQARERERFRQMVVTVNRRMGPKAQIPRTFPDYLRYSEGVTNAGKERIQHVLANQDVPKLNVQPFGGKVFNDGRSAVLAEHTIWSPNQHVHLPQRYGSYVWPSREELLFEGDERSKTNYGRYLPLVRGYNIENETVNWKIMHQLQPLGFDFVSQPPSVEDIYAPVEEIEEHMIPALLNADLLAALDLDV